MFYLCSVFAIFYCSVLDGDAVFGVLSSVICQSEDKQICIRALWCMEKQEFPIKLFDNFAKVGEEELGNWWRLFPI